MLLHASCGDTELSNKRIEAHGWRCEMAVSAGNACRECWAASVLVDKAFPVLVQLWTPVDLSSTVS